MRWRRGSSVRSRAFWKATVPVLERVGRIDPPNRGLWKSETELTRRERNAHRGTVRVGGQAEVHPFARVEASRALCCALHIATDLANDAHTQERRLFLGGGLRRAFRHTRVRLEGGKRLLGDFPGRTALACRAPAHMLLHGVARAAAGRRGAPCAPARGAILRAGARGGRGRARSRTRRLSQDQTRERDATLLTLRRLRRSPPPTPPSRRGPNRATPVRHRRASSPRSRTCPKRTRPLPRCSPRSTSRKPLEPHLRSAHPENNMYTPLPTWRSISRYHLDETGALDTRGHQCFVLCSRHLVEVRFRKPIIQEPGPTPGNSKTDKLIKKLLLSSDVPPRRIRPDMDVDKILDCAPSTLLFYLYKKNRPAIGNSTKARPESNRGF